MSPPPNRRIAPCEHRPDAGAVLRLHGAGYAHRLLHGLGGDRDGAGRRPTPRTASGPAVLRFARQFLAARGAAVHPGRRADERRRHHRAPGRHVARVDRPSARRARPGQHPDQHVHGGGLGLRAGRPRRYRLDDDPGDETGGLQAGLRGRRDRLRGDDGADHSAQHHRGDLRLRHGRIDRRAVPRRRHSGRAGWDVDDASHLVPGASGRCRARHYGPLAPRW